jgi:hypothetical protein
VQQVRLIVKRVQVGFDAEQFPGDPEKTFKIQPQGKSPLIVAADNPEQA